MTFWPRSRRASPNSTGSGEKEQTKADVKVFILDEVYASLAAPPFTPEEREAVAADVYTHVWQQAVSGEFARAA